MSYQMAVTLTDEEYSWLSAQAAQTGKSIESLVHEALAQRLQPSTPSTQPLTGRALMEKLYREGKIMNLPTGQSLTEEEKAQRERLAQALGGGKPLSEMVIEDRGPR